MKKTEGLFHHVVRNFVNQLGCGGIIHIMILKTAKIKSYASCSLKVRVQIQRTFPVVKIKQLFSVENEGNKYTSCQNTPKFHPAKKGKSP